MAEDADVGFEEGMSWLPAHILREACGDFSEEQLDRRGRARHYQHHHHHAKGLESQPPPPQLKSGRKYSSKPRHGTNNRASGGPGMQAIFLDPAGHKSCGTGVFLPKRAGTDFQPTKKPACAPVLLPSRVVQALNLNIQAIGLQISPRQDHKINKQKGRTGGDKSVYNKDGEDVRDRCYVISQEQSSPEIFLPKEWSY